jgi:hypothetical protein
VRQSRIEERIAEIPGVHAVATRVVADVTLDVPAWRSRRPAD